MNPELSIVIAAFNEEKRLPKTLDRMTRFLESNKLDYEFVLVNDGSRDNTLAWITEYASQHPRVRVLSHFPNQGRGSSIKEGVLSARGTFVLETDADGSTADEDIVRFLQYFAEHPEVEAVFGSRYMRGSHIVVDQPPLRIFLGRGFIYLARILFGLWHVSDFTLGFKMFRQSVIRDIFEHQYDNHYVAEPEIMYIAHKRGHKVAQLPVNWTDNRDSRIRPFRDVYRSLRGVTKMLVRNMQGRYS